MKKAWVENNVVRDISFFEDVATSYHPDIAKLYVTQIPDHVQKSWILINDVWTDPSTLPRPDEEPRT